MSTLRIHFNQFPAETRKALEVYVRGRQPLLSRRRADGIGGVALAVVVTGLLGVVSWAFVRAQLARHDGVPLAGMMLLGPALGFAFALVGSALGSLRTPPFVRGVYVFPTDLVDARGPVWKLTPLRECRISGEHWVSNANDFERLFPGLGPQKWTVRVDGHAFDTSGTGSLKSALAALRRALEREAAGTLGPTDDKFRGLRQLDGSTQDPHPATGIRYTAADAWAGRATWVGFLLGFALSPVVIALVNRSTQS